MSYSNVIQSLNCDLLSGTTTVYVDVVEDLGFAKRTKDRLTLQFTGKFLGLTPELQAAVDDHISQHAEALGLV